MTLEICRLTAEGSSVSASLREILHETWNGLDSITWRIAELSPRIDQRSVGVRWET